MLRQRRQGLIGPRRPTLTAEALEDRTLLDGVVTALLNPGTGLLQITGDGGDNQLTIAPAATPGQIRVSWSSGSVTSSNGDTTAEFALTAITDIRMTLPNGRDSVLVTGFSIPGDLTVSYGNSSDSFSLPNFGAKHINLLFAGPDSGGGLGSGNNGGLLAPLLSGSFSLTGVNADAVTIVTGKDTASVSLSASTLGRATINTAGAGNATITVSGSTVANLIVSAGQGNNQISVTGTQMATAAIATGTGANTVKVSDVTMSSESAAPTLTVNVGAFGSPNNVQKVMLFNLVFNTNGPNVQNNGSLTVTVGDSIPPAASDGRSALLLSQISGVDGATVRAGANWDTVSLDTMTARTLAVVAGDNTIDFFLNALTVGGPLNAQVGANAHNVQLTNITTAVLPTDLALGRLADVNLNIGNGAQNVTLDTFQVGHNLTIVNGDGNTRFTIGNGTVGNDLTLLTGNGRNQIVLDTIQVLNQLFAQAGSGSNSAAAHAVTSGSGRIDGGSGASTVYWDQGGNAGFDVINFTDFLTGVP